MPNGMGCGRPRGTAASPRDASRRHARRSVRDHRPDPGAAYDGGDGPLRSTRPFRRAPGAPRRRSVGGDHLGWRCPSRRRRPTPLRGRIHPRRPGISPCQSPPGAGTGVAAVRPGGGVPRDALAAGSPEFETAAASAMRDIPTAPHVVRVVSHLLQPRQVSADGHTAYDIVLLDLPADDSPDALPILRERLGDAPGLTVELAGGPAFYGDVQHVSERDLQRSEVISLPLAALALLIVFASLVAAACRSWSAGRASWSRWRRSSSSPSSRR